MADDWSFLMGMWGCLRRKENALLKVLKKNKQYRNAFILRSCPRGFVKRVATTGMVLDNNE